MGSAAPLGDRTNVPPRAERVNASVLPTQHESGSGGVFLVETGGVLQHSTAH